MPGLFRRLAALPLLALVSICAIHGFATAADLWAVNTFFNGVMRLDDQTGAPVPGDVSGGFPGSAGLDFPAGAAIGPDGNLYVSSQNTGEVLIYDGITGQPVDLGHGRAGLFTSLVDETSAEPAPGHIDFGPDGHLYVSDFGSTRIRKFDGTTGASLPDVGGVFVNGGGLAFAPNGDLYFGDFSAGMIFRIHNGMQEVFVANDPAPESLKTPASMVFTPEGDLLVVDLYANRVLRFDETGQPIHRYAPEDVNQETPLPFIDIPPAIEFPLPPGITIPSNNPSDIAWDPDGNLVISVLGLTYPPDNRGAIYRYDTDGNLIETIADGLPGVGGIAFGWSQAVPVPGDYDGDGFVAASDYDKWKNDYGKFVAKYLGADGNGDGIVDAVDYTVWRNNVPEELGAGGLSVVPEPSVVSLLAVALCFAASATRRK